MLNMTYYFIQKYLTIKAKIRRRIQNNVVYKQCTLKLLLFNLLDNLNKYRKTSTNYNTYSQSYFYTQLTVS